MTRGTSLDLAVDQALERGEVGLQIAAYHRGELVMDQCAGSTCTGGLAVDADTIFWVASAGKVSTATALHAQVERGLLTYDQPISSVWPEFGAHGKDSFTVRDALTHRVGLADLPDDATPELMGDWDWMVDRLARTTPNPEPARREMYHARTWGYLVGEIIRRSDPACRSFEDLVREEVHEPLAISGVWHRLPDAEQDRVAVTKGDIFSGDPITFTVTEDHEFNTASFRSNVDPNGGWMTAREGARLWALYAQGGELDGNRILSADRIQTFLDPRPTDIAAGWMAGQRAVIGQGGLMLGGQLHDHRDELGVGKRTLWHPGAGGALGFADLDSELAVMICHNELFDERPHDQHPFAPLVRAIYRDLIG